MSCNFVQGYEIDCRDSVGGIKKIYIAKHSDVSSITESSGVVTSISMSSGKKFWVYDLEKENASFTEAEQNSVENGTVFYEPSVNFTIKKMTAANRNNIRVLSQSVMMVIVEDNNGNKWLVGRYNGLDKTGDNSAATGKALGDMNGYTVNLMGKEPEPHFSFTGTVPTT